MPRSFRGRYHYKTAWDMHKRIRDAMKNADEKYRPEGIVTVDEAFFREKMILTASRKREAEERLKAR